MNTHGIIPVSEDIDRQAYEQILSFIRLRVTETYAYPPEIVQVDGITIATLGNFSASVGKPKSKKTFNCAAIVASALSGRNILHYKAHLPEGKHKVLYVDTEQSKCHCHKVLERILKTGRDADRPGNGQAGVLHAAGVQSQAAEANHQPCACFRPGDRLCRDRRHPRPDVRHQQPPSESVDLINDLMRWSSMHDLHIHTVLHLNKGDDNTRGHIGTELNNKAETILQVTKSQFDSNISEVKAMHIREREFQPFAFRINREALPELVEDYAFTQERKPTTEAITDAQHAQALEIAFGSGRLLGMDFSSSLCGKGMRKSVSSADAMSASN